MFFFVCWVGCDIVLLKKIQLQSRELHAPDEEKASLLDQIQTLEEKLEVLNKEVEELSKEYCEEELQEHIDKLHEYNEIKDVGQLIIGKLGYQMFFSSIKWLFNEWHYTTLCSHFYPVVNYISSYTVL